MINRIVLIGRLASDPELRYIASGVPVATFVIAVDRRPNQQGERETDFVPIVAWRQRAEFAAQYLTKGRLVAVDGRLQIRSWVAQDGTRRKSAEVVADDLKSLDKPKSADEPADELTTEEVVERVEEPAMSSSEEIDDPFADE